MNNGSRLLIIIYSRGLEAVVHKPRETISLEGILKYLRKVKTGMLCRKH